MSRLVNEELLHGLYLLFCGIVSFGSCCWVIRAVLWSVLWHCWLGVRKSGCSGSGSSAVASHTGLPPVSDQIARGQNAIFGHVARLPDIVTLDYCICRLLSWLLCAIQILLLTYTYKNVSPVGSKDILETGTTDCITLSTNAVCLTNSRDDSSLVITVGNMHIVVVIFVISCSARTIVSNKAIPLTK